MATPSRAAPILTCSEDTTSSVAATTTTASSNGTPAAGRVAIDATVTCEVDIEDHGGHDGHMGKMRWLRDDNGKFYVHDRAGLFLIPIIVIAAVAFGLGR